MSTRLHRRTVLGTALGVGAVAGLAGPARSLHPGRATARTRRRSGVHVALGDVRLTESRFLANMRRTTAYLRDVDLDRLLHMFRVTAGLPSSAQPLGGWEAPTCSCAGTPPDTCSAAWRSRPPTSATRVWRPRPPAGRGPGRVPGAVAGDGPHARYLSAFPEKAFVDLEAGKNVWAPYYTLHKVMAGCSTSTGCSATTRRSSPARDGRLGGHPDLRTHPRADAEGPAHRVRRRERDAGQPVVRHRTPPPRAGRALRPRRDLRPLAERRNTLAGRMPTPTSPRWSGRGAVGGDRRGALPHHRDVLLGPGRPAPHLRHRRQQQRRVLRPSRTDRQPARREHLRELQQLQHAQAQPPAVPHAAGPGGLHGLLRVDAAQPDAGRAGP